MLLKPKKSSISRLNAGPSSLAHVGMREPAGQLQDGLLNRARVFGVNVDGAAFECLEADEGAAEGEAALDGEAAISRSWAMISASTCPSTSCLQPMRLFDPVGAGLQGRWRQYGQTSMEAQDQRQTAVAA